MNGHWLPHLHTHAPPAHLHTWPQAAHEHVPLPAPYPQDDPRWVLADPICTFVFAFLVLLTTRGIIRDILHTLMERSPVQHDVVEMVEAMVQVGGHFKHVMFGV